MGLGDLFKLSKLTITAYTSPGRKEKIGEPFEAQYNPESLSTRYESVYQNQPGLGSSSGSQKYTGSRSKELNINLVFDGTAVDFFGYERLIKVPTVAERIQSFLAVCYDMQGKLHEPAYLEVRWSEDVLQPVFDCRLKSVDIKYTAFDRDGSPLRAELAALFVEDLAPEKRAALEGKQSPDLTHRRTVLAGDTLPALCREIYGSPEHYLRVAEINGLNDLRTLTPGQELRFPPYQRSGRT